jgi:hypothetical protein
MPDDLAIRDERLDLLVTQAAQRLASATTAAAVLEAKALAGVAYDAAKAAIRFAKIQGAADEVFAAARRVEADALEIEAGAKQRLDDEYRAARAAGVVARQGERTDLFLDGEKVPPTQPGLGLNHNDLADGRLLNKAEAVEPGVTRRILEEQLIRGDEPTRAALRREVEAVAMQALAGADFSEVTRHPRAGRTAPDPNFDAMAQVAGCCRRLVELVEANGVEAIRAGFLNEGIRLDTVPLFHAAHAALVQLIEACNDEAHPYQLQAGASHPAGDATGG